MTNAGVAGVLRMLRGGEVDAAAVRDAFLHRARGLSRLNALVCEVVDEGDAGGIFAGLPVVHKDVFCQLGQKTTCASNMLADFTAPYDAAVVEKCRAAGMHCFARANMDEFAMGSSGEHSAFGATKNPWDESRTPGGSSSGSAAAVAARITPLATGTDTGGSIRQPAAFCGISGIKPTYGRVSRRGLVAFASGFDQAGVLAASAEDCALGLSAICGFDERDSTSLDIPAEDFAAGLQKPLTGLRIGKPKQFFDEGLDGGVGGLVEDALSEMQKAGAKIIDISLPSMRYAVAAYYVLTSAEASSNLSRYDGVRYGRRAKAAGDITSLFEQSRAEGFGAEVKRRILAGAFVLSYGYRDDYYRRAMRARKRIAEEFRHAFEECDIIAGPTTPSPAFMLGEIGDDDPVRMYLQDIYTVPINLAGLPAMSLPCGFTGGLPAGMQFIAPPLAEQALLAAAHQYQQITKWHKKAPQLELS
ncbi:MAG: Asp-tRNA(Asn)/Glu-tRNA(Gln) amidotransferase subunit GatA [Gammaproteobacteria bacterium]